jgi:alpha-glucosidase (family GH31 glycosyl hydrolase)
LGPANDLLVAPITSPGAENASTYLPPGRWVNVWTSVIVTGDRTITTPAPIDQIPVWCRQKAWTTLRLLFAEG